MRIGIKSDDKFLSVLNEKNHKIQERFQQNIEELTKTVQIKVMLGDSTVKDEKTFDPKTIELFYRKFINELKDWSHQDVSISYNDDVRRIFIKFETNIENYLLISIHLLMNQIRIRVYPILNCNLFKPQNLSYEILI